MIEPKKITSIENLIKQVRKDFKEWGSTSFAWFRGEMNNTKYPLTPKLYRPVEGKPPHNENRLLQHFRLKAPSFSPGTTPPKENTDEWLFLAQHAGLPTRLLDWTEGLFFALHFALNYEEPVIWMLDPIELNRREHPSATNDFPLTWFSPDKTHVTITDLAQAAQLIIDAFSKSDKETVSLQITQERNIGNLNIRGAWEKDKYGTNLPTAILPSYIHARMNAQRSCFTIQGKVKDSLENLVDDRILKKYVIPRRYVNGIKGDLRTIGITNASVFPDIDNLAKDLSNIF